MYRAFGSVDFHLETTFKQKSIKLITFWNLCKITSFGSSKPQNPQARDKPGVSLGIRADKADKPGIRLGIRLIRLGISLG